MYGVDAVEFPIIFTTDNLPKSLIPISGISHEYVKVRVNATVNIPSVPNTKVGVADAPLPPLTAVNTNVGAVAKFLPPLFIVIPITDAPTKAQVITASIPAVERTEIEGADV